MISPLAYVHPNAQIGKNVTIGAFAYIEENVVIGDNTEIAAHASILNFSRIGKNTKIFSNAVVGGIPQDLKFAGEESYAIIGDNCMLRECVTVNRGTKSKGKTVIGDNCLLMAYCHVAHDTILHNNVIMSNAVQLAGEVEVFEHAIIGGGSLIHQFTKIGQHSMTQGGSKVNKDIPPFVVVARDPITYAGLNIVGLRRRGYKNEEIETIKDIYRVIFHEGLNATTAITKIETQYPDSQYKSIIVDFVKDSIASRGIVKSYLDK